MIEWLKNNLVALTVPLVILIGGIAVTQHQVVQIQEELNLRKAYITTQFELKQRVSLLERNQVDKSRILTDNTSFKSDVINLQGSDRRLQSGLDKHEVAIEGLNKRVSSIEITSAETMVVLTEISKALEAQTKATTKLTEQVIRLEERIKRDN